MQSDPSVKQALTIAYQLLSYRPRSVHEVRKKLLAIGCHEGTVDAVIEHLRKLRYLDDAGFAKFWVEARMKHKPMGSYLLKKDLKHKGLDASLVEKAIKEKNITYDEFDVALTLARRRLQSYGKIQKLKAKKRMHDFLIRRGFEFDIVRRVLEELFRP